MSRERTLSVRQEHLLLERLEAAGLTSEDTQAVIESKGNKLAKTVVAFIRNGGLPLPANGGSATKDLPRPAAASIALREALAIRQPKWALRIGPPEDWDSEKPWDINALVTLVGSKTQPVPHRVTDYVKQYLVPEIVVAQTASVEEAVEITIRDLGFSRTTRKEVWYPKLAEAGFEELPQETAFHAAIQYGHTLSVGEWLAIISEDIVDSHSDRRFLDVARREGGVCVGDVWADPRNGWGPDYRLLVRRKSQPVSV